MAEPEKSFDIPTMPGWAIVMREQLTTLTGQLEDLRVAIAETQRSLKGHNGTAGLITRFALLEGSVHELLQEIRDNREDQKTDLKHLTDNLAENSVKFVTWPYLLEKFGAPIILTVIGFIITALCPALIVLAYFLPQIIKAIGVQGP